jgi:predicted ATPase/DNA-binding winged helix-turn-helix (wHTH) protein
MPSAAQWLFGPFRLDVANACLWRGHELLPLRPKPFAVLVHLVAHAGQLVTKEALFEAIWPDMVVSDTVLKAHVRRIRQALGDTVQTPRFVATVHRRGYRFIAPVVAADEPDAEHPDASPPPDPVAGPPAPPVAPTQRPPLLVERESVLRQLHTWLEEAASGRHQVVFVTGEPGIGKTAVVEAFTAQVAANPQVCVAWGQCVEHFGAGEAYMPVLEALAQLCRGPVRSQVMRQLRHHAPTWLVQMPWLLSPADRDVLQHELSGTTRERMLREFTALMGSLTAEIALVLVLEDMHWSDHATLDLLGVLARHREASRLMIVGTYRPVDAIVHDLPLQAMKHDLQLHRYCQELPLAPLSETAMAEYLQACFPGGVFPAALIHRLYRRTDGNPLFLVSVMAHLVTHGVLQEHEGRWALRGDAIDMAIEVPESLRQMIAQQLDHLAPDVQRVIEAGSVAGVEFTAAAVAVSLDNTLEEVEACCERLAQRGQILRSAGVVEWPEGTMTARYVFQHALYQQVAYQRLGEVRRIQLHRRLGERLEAAYGDRASELAADLARHFVRGRDPARAIRYLRQAAEIALQRHAHRDAIDYLNRALRALRDCPDTPERTQQELQVYLALGGPLMATKGQAASEVEEVYGRAYALCQQVKPTAQLLPVLAGLRRYYVVRGAHNMAWDLAERLLRLAQQHGARTYELEAHRALGTTRFFRGELPEALDHLRQAMALYEPASSQVSAVLGDPQLSCLLYVARSLWSLGYPDQARLRAEEALALAQRLSHPYSLVWSQSFIADLYQLRGDDDAALALIEASLRMAEKQGLPYWMARGLCMHGVLLAKQGRRDEGIAQMGQGLEAMRTTGAGLNRAYFLAQLAAAYAQAEQSAAGLAAVAEALELVARTGEGWWEAELHRLRGELLLVQQGTADPTPPHLPLVAEAEQCLQRALTIARQQRAKTLELRAAMSLSRFWQRQGKGAEARRLLGEVYQWFTEGFQTQDLLGARALLQGLRASAR